MRKIQNNIELAATDLSNHIACHYLTYLNLAEAEKKIKSPDYWDPSLAVLQAKGLEFERFYLNSLKEKGISISESMDDEDTSDVERTLSAMQKGTGVIYQASLKNGAWRGRADFLLRVERPGKLGAWSYEVADSKLATETRAGTVLQICLYSELLSEIQGTMPEFMHVVTPEDGLTTHSYRLDDFLAYYRFVRGRLLTAIENGTSEKILYPNPVAHCDICRWWQHCNDKRRADDHLSFVAGLSNAHAKEINKWDVQTLGQFAELPSPLQYNPSKGAKETYERLKEQARLQFESRNKTTPLYELLKLNDEKGFFKLTQPSDGDMFFDFESDPLAGTNGLEYLFGWTYADEPDESYHRIWALKHEDEKKAFETFIDIVMKRWEKFPDMHIYHYTAYEPAALKRLMGKYATRETEMDRMLRGGLFVDLYYITKQALQAGIERYSLKELEVFYEFRRKLELRDAASQLRVIEKFIETNITDGIPKETIDAIEIYNKEDCLSTKNLRNWLENLREKLVKEGDNIPRPELKSGEASDNVTERQERVRAIREKLMIGIPLSPEERDNKQHATWLLANMLDWYWREQKSKWWEYYRLAELPDEDLLREKAGLAFLNFTGYEAPVKKSVIHRYKFPDQECEIREGDKVKTKDGKEFGTVVSIDTNKCTIDIKKGPSKAKIHPHSIFSHDDVAYEIKEEAIFRIADWVADNGIDGNGPFRAGRDLLLRNPPRTKDAFSKNGSPLEVGLNWLQSLDNGVLPIQGPPGAGKSHTAAHMIVSLVKAGKKVGITALSHKVIRNLLQKAVRVANENDVPLSCVQKVSEASGNPHPQITEVTDNNAVLTFLQSGMATVAAGTAWLWTREEFADAVDVLFVDEAGQLSLIDALAVSQSAKNIVLLGDPQQLKQPQQGSHPEGTEVSALEHILNGHQTIPDESGLFLNETWRMHPNICSFISEMFYEGKLTPRPNLINQVIRGNTDYKDAGLWLEAVEHSGNQNCSIEEVNRVSKIISDLTTNEVFWTNKENETKRITINDIMVIAPYNAQVVMLQSYLPTGTHIGTVDKFQGQEAPVVVCSMSTSSPEDAPRGMEFLYSLNRLNVAVSRAKTACMLVASPKLFELDCKSPGQMRLANAFCRYREVAMEQRETANGKVERET